MKLEIGDDLMKEEKRYPIYSFAAEWDQDDYEHNGTGFTMMYKEKPTDEQLHIELENFKTKLENRHLESGHPIIKWHRLEYSYVEDEVWALIWFYHMTYNQFENDSEALESFERFVTRKELQNIKEGHDAGYALMGAEDRWRWEVCHCDGCKKNGWVAINH